MRPVFLCDAVRTPIGRYGGALATVRPDDLAAIPIGELLRRHPKADWSALDDVILGCANQAGEDNRNVARMALLLAGLPEGVSGTTINRLCGSGMDAVGTAARAIASGEAEFVIAGGVESMSRAPFVMGKAEAAFQRSAEVYDTTIGWRFVNRRMREAYGTDSMPETGENVARACAVEREAQDAFAWRSQMRFARAQREGFFAEEIVPVVVASKKDTTTVDRDEHPRPESTLEKLASLKPLFAGGTITAGNASGVNDGAAAMIVASEDAVHRHGLRPRARILGMAAAGVAPRVMGIGPVPATQKLLGRLQMSIGNFDWIELNEAFASQALACLRQLGLADDAENVNPNGGAIALGHPLGMSGARLVQTAALQLEKSGGKLALATMCIGVGQGIAMAIERVQGG
ncbi:MAG: 3-oxoadipyl-CoA thiolase [Acidobacteriota bacterium]|nr:3-oxoadipyl-CoA thiolase [Acidobacteriota bacterium]